MNRCCHTNQPQTHHLLVNPAPKSSAWFRGIGETLAWAIPGILLILMPKCPACLALIVLLWTGLGISLAAAVFLKWSLLIACGVFLSVLIVQRWRCL